MIGKGFANPNVQKKIVETVRERYGVDNISHVSEIRQKISASNVGKHNVLMTDETKILIGNASRLRWTDPLYKTRTSAAIKKSVNTLEERSRRSKKMKEQLNDDNFRKLAWANHKNCLTKMHQRMRAALGLDELGFVPEQHIGRRRVDDLNEEKKIVVEFFGDHPHANPKSHAPDDVIRLPGQSYTAAYKWQQDQSRKEELESNGYTVFIIWESDDIVKARVRLEQYLHHGYDHRRRTPHDDS